jgi:hypothetical protein
MSDAAVSERISRKRGRPRVLVEHAEAAYRQLFPEVRSRRSLQNRAYSSHALAVLAGVPEHRQRFRWLVGSDGNTLRMGALVELGRYRDEQSILNLADAMCRAAAERRLTTSEAAALVRSGRGRRGPREFCKPSQDGLVTALSAALDRYQRTHPGLAKATILEALNEVYGVVAEVMESEGRKVL